MEDGIQALAKFAKSMQTKYSDTRPAGADLGKIKDELKGARKRRMELEAAADSEISQDTGITVAQENLSDLNDVIDEFEDLIYPDTE